MNTYYALAEAIVANRCFCWIGTPRQQERWMSQASLHTRHVRRETW